MARLTARLERLEGARARLDTRPLEELSSAELLERIARCRLRMIELGGDPDTVIAEAEAEGRASPGIGDRVRAIKLPGIDCRTTIQ